MKSGVIKLTEAFDKQLETSAAQYQLLKSQLGIVMIDLGKKIIPFLLGAVQVLSKGVSLLSISWQGNKLAMEKIILKAYELRARLWGLTDDEKMYADAQKDVAEQTDKLRREWLELDEVFE